MKLFLAILLALAIAIGGAACSPTAADQKCQSASGARICLNALGGSAYTVTGSGLKPGSEVNIKLPGPGLPDTGKADSRGGFPESGAVFDLGAGIKAVDFPIDATSGSGTPISLTFHLPAAER